MALVACHRCTFPPSSHFSLAVFNRSPSARRQLTFPAVPASLPAQFTNLTELESLEIVGNGNTPGMTCVFAEWCIYSSTCSWPIPDRLWRFDQTHDFAS